ncbi:MAG: M20/M25/M40 family metallo-hydrolase [Thermoanaerobaculia bacterium]|nr:M20/M25/M40 family metallo-hydrolase [Thermoanaerobaculia bacterium]
MGDEGRAPNLRACFDARRDQIVALVEELVVRESPSERPELVTALVRFVADFLRARGFSAECLPSGAGSGEALWVHSDPPSATLILGHADTVWPEGTIRAIPFANQDGLLSGPGVFDMKAGIAIAMAVAAAAAEGEVRLKDGFSLFLTPDEETGSTASREKIVAIARRHKRVLVMEPAGERGAAKVARKGTGLVTARFTGVAAHAGLEPEKGASALMEMVRFAVFADLLAHPGRETSVVPTLARAGTKANVVPESAEVTVDCRFWTREESERVLGALGTYAPEDPRITVRVEGGLGRPPMEPTPESLGLFEHAAAIATALGFALPAVRVGGASDGNFTAAEGIPTLDGLGPSGRGAHSRSESVIVDDLPRRAALLAALLEEVHP